MLQYVVVIFPLCNFLLFLVNIKPKSINGDNEESIIVISVKPQLHVCFRSSFLFSIETTLRLSEIQLFRNVSIA